MSEETDAATELLLFFYIQKRVEMVSEEVAILNEQYQQHILGEDFLRCEGHLDEAKEQKELSKKVYAEMIENRDALDVYKTKRDALMDIIEGEE